MTGSSQLARLRALNIDGYQLRGREQEDEHSVEPVSEHEHVLSSGPAGGTVESPATSATWSELPDLVEACRACELGASRTRSVFGAGAEAADWMIIGEAPGAEEDRSGEPFAGRAGQLMDEMLTAIGLSRESVFIANVLKCRPPNNRDPAAGELAACRHFLDAQIAHVKPRLILIVGRIAAQALLATKAPLGRLRGQAHKLAPFDVPVVVTYHPAYLLRSSAQKAKAWQDLKMARTLMRESA